MLILGVVGEARERTISSGLSYNQDERGVGRGRIVGQRQILYDHYGKLGCFTNLNKFRILRI